MTKNEKGVIVVNWKDMYDPESIYRFLRDMRWMTINDIHINVENQFTTIDGLYNSSLSPNSGNFEIIPKEVYYEDNTAKYKIIKQISDLADFPEVNNFISTHCSYIKEWLDKNQEERSLELKCEIKISRSDDLGTVTDQLMNVKLAKSIFDDPKKKTDLSILVLAATIKRFYQPDIKEFEIRNLTTDLQKINSNNDVLLEILKNPMKTLENYDIEVNDVNNKILSYHNSNFSVMFKKFKFLKNTILTTPFFELYRQNLDLKFLSYVVTMKKLDVQRSLF
jgi:hypothetical protein